MSISRRKRCTLSLSCIICFSTFLSVVVPKCMSLRIVNLFELYATEREILIFLKSDKQIETEIPAKYNSPTVQPNTTNYTIGSSTCISLYLGMKIGKQDKNTLMFSRYVNKPPNPNPIIIRLTKEQKRPRPSNLWPLYRCTRSQNSTCVFF